MRNAEGIKRIHARSCEYARPNSLCKCRCEGRFHAASSEVERQDYGIRLLAENLGGEAGEFIRAYTGREFHCWSGGGHSFSLTHFVGYPHSAGLADRVGIKWWLYHVCPHCNYQWSFWKIENRLGRQDERRIGEAEKQTALVV